jgi:protein-disulfide isomerase
VGAARKNNRKKKKQSPGKGGAAAARAVSAARGTNRDLTKIIIAAVVVAVILGAVIFGVLLQKNKADQAAQTVIPALTVPGSSSYPAAVDKASATVLVGKSDAKVTVDAYEDFLCPICGQFETANWTSMESQLAAGHIKVRYHMINLLDSRSIPAGYSMIAANTALAVATVAPAKFVDFHYSLYQKQPQEQGPGWTQAQLTNLANRLGVTGSAYDKLINDNTYNQQIQTNMTSANSNTALFATTSQGTGFGTPTVVINNKVINWQSDTSWLANAVKVAYPTT